MRINEYAKRTKPRNSDNYILDTDTGVYRITAADLKTFIRNMMESNEVEFDSEMMSNEYLDLQNEDTGEHTRISIVELISGATEVAKETNIPSSYPDGTLPSDRQTASNWKIIIENTADAKDPVKKISLSQLLHYVVAQSFTSDITADNSGNVIKYLGTQNDKICSVERGKLPSKTLNESSAPSEFIDVFSNLGVSGKITIQEIVDYAIKIVKQQLPGTLIPKGSVLFKDLPTKPEVGWMYNIRDDFYTDSRFVEGANYQYPLGTNVYYTADNKWDVMVGPGVMGLRGAGQINYKKGYVTFSPSDIGLDVEQLTDEVIKNIIDEQAKSFVSGVKGDGESVYRKGDVNIAYSDLYTKEEILDSVQDASLIDTGIFFDTRRLVRLVTIKNYIQDYIDISSRYLSLKGGNMTGNIGFKGQSKTYNMISFIDGGTEYGHGIVIGGGGATIVGGGESAATMSQNLDNGGVERLYLCNDNYIDFYTNCQNGIDSAVHTQITATGEFTGISTKAKQDAKGHEIVVPFKFGIDSNGNYGYIKAGADTVTPFSKTLKYDTWYNGKQIYNGSTYSIDVSSLVGIDVKNITYPFILILLLDQISLNNYYNTEAYPSFQTLYYDESYTNPVVVSVNSPIYDAIKNDAINPELLEHIPQNNIVLDKVKSIIDFFNVKYWTFIDYNNLFFGNNVFRFIMSYIDVPSGYNGSSRSRYKASALMIQYVSSTTNTGHENLDNIIVSTL